MDTDIDSLTKLFFSIAGLSGVAGLFWGIYQYRQNRIEKRKDILFELVREFDQSEKMNFAKRILDDYSLEIEDGWLNKPGFYHKSNLNTILRLHHESTISDPGEISIRDSFDTLFDFFDRLGYLFKVGLVKKYELSHFEYFLTRARDNDSIVKYVQFYGFRWLTQIPSDINY